MMTTPRLTLPLIEAGQAQKEIVHNEALALIDIALQASVVAIGVNDAPADPHAGQCWVVGTMPTGAWAGHADAIAGWTANGWRFVDARVGLTVWSVADAAQATSTSGGWVIESPSAAIATPTGGTVVDVEARAAIGAVLTAMRARRIITGG